MDNLEQRQKEFAEMQSIKQEMGEYDKQRRDKYLHDSKDRLGRIVKGKVTTTMIGAIASLEANFGPLWGNCDTDEERRIYDLFQKTRSEILDKGNAQARNIDVELNQYEVKWLRYNMTLPFIPRNTNKKDQSND